MSATGRSLNTLTEITLSTQLTTKERFRLKEPSVFKKEEHHLNQ